MRRLIPSHFRVVVHCVVVGGGGDEQGSRPPDNGQHTKISASHLINQQQTANKPSPCRTAVAGVAAAAPRVTYGGHPLFFLIVTRRCDVRSDGPEECSAS